VISFTLALLPRKRLPAYQPSASSTFFSEQTSRQQSANSTFLSEHTSISHQPPAKRTGCLPVDASTLASVAACLAASSN
jgi:hypothetical protein